MLLQLCVSDAAVPGLRGVLAVACCRCISNVMSKWIDAAWVVAAQAQQQQQQQQQAASAGQAAAAVSSVVRVHCCWQQSCTATGRLSSCSPNLQVRRLM
jgi:hypothetical protein